MKAKGKLIPEYIVKVQSLSSIIDYLASSLKHSKHHISEILHIVWRVDKQVLSSDGCDCCEG